jgi:hypothetical protein
MKYDDLLRMATASLQVPIARNTDPRSSHAAAAEITHSSARLRQSVRVLLLVLAHPGRTSRELAEHGLDRYIIARRLPELEEAGAVFRSGFRVCTQGKRVATTWLPTPRAQRAIEKAMGS